MGLFDRVRQVLAKGEKVLPGRDREPGDAGPGQERRPDASDGPTSLEPEQAAEVPGADVTGGTGEGTPGAEPDAAEEPVQPRRYRTHTLRPDQSLAEVAELHGVSLERLAELNGLDPALVFAGQVVRIPPD